MVQDSNKQAQPAPVDYIFPQPIPPNRRHVRTHEGRMTFVSRSTGEPAEPVAATKPDATAGASGQDVPVIVPVVFEAVAP